MWQDQNICHVMSEFGVCTDRCGPHEQAGNRGRAGKPVIENPAEEARRFRKFLQIHVFRLACDIRAHDKAAMHIPHDIGRKIVQHCAIDQQILAVHDRRQDARQRDGRPQRIAQQAFAMDARGAAGEVGRGTEKGNVEITDLRVAEMLFQPGCDARAFHHADDGQMIVPERIAIDKCLADALLDFGIAPPHCDTGRDDRAHRGAAHKIDRQAKFPHRLDDADMRIGARAPA